MSVRYHLVVATIMLGAIGTQGLGQGRPRGPGMRLATLQTDATVKLVRPGALLVTTDKNAQWLVSIPRQIEAVEYHAEATRAVLKRGMVIRFNAVLDRRLRAQRDVQAVSIVTLRKGVEPGVFPDNEMAGKDNLFNTQPAGNAKRKSRRTVVAVPCLVIGQLFDIKKSTMTVAAGRAIVEAPLSTNAQVSIAVNDYRWASPGDKVQVDARYLPQQPGRAEGQRLVITAAQKLGESRQATRRRGTSPKPKSADEDKAKDADPDVIAKPAKAKT